MFCWQRAVVLCGLFCVAGCAQQGNRSGDATVSRATEAGLQIAHTTADGFDLLLVRNASVPDVTAKGAASSATLRVYLAGDGTPWQGDQVARDPGPRKPLAIELMLRDPAPAVYLGRPCYHRQTPACRPSLWSFERFGPRVVNAMAIALRQLSSAAEGARLTLVGYSGGGVLATLLAHEVDEVDTLVTIAAPLDIAAWTALHDYTPLLGSLDPAAGPPLRGTVRQLHFQGAADKEVPPEIAGRYLDRQHNAHFEVLRGQTHSCCWVDQWPRLLAQTVRNTP